MPLAMTLITSLPAAAAHSPHRALDEDFAHIKAQLRMSQDSVEPAVRAESARRLMSWLARSSVKLNFFLGTALVLSLGLNVFLGWYATHPVREYFGVDNGRIFPLIPQSHPYRKPPDVIQYATDAIRKSFTMDFNNWRDDLERVRTLYTTNGFKSFLTQLKESGFLESVRTKRMNMSLVSGGGVLIKDGVENGTYVWFVEFPIEVRLAGQTSEFAPQKFKAIVRVERVSPK
jgi:intracellular multiplication protein IcmL